MNEKRLRFDLFIALTALLVSTIAAAASVYQTRVIAHQTEIINEQFGATTWPYLSFTSSYSPKELSVELRNDGLGPAILRDVTITRDGKEVPPGSSHSALNQALTPETTAAVADAEIARKHGKNGSITTSISSLANGDVIPAGSRTTLLHAIGPIVARRYASAQPHVGIKLCYCSLLNRCWLKVYDTEGTPPREVPGCPLHKDSAS